jgi:hypothetical protein
MAIPAIFYGLGIAPTFSIYALFAVSWLAIAVRVLVALALTGSNKFLKPAPKDQHALVWGMHIVSIVAMVMLYVAGFKITTACLAISSVMVFIIFLKANYFQTSQIEE